MIVTLKVAASLLCNGKFFSFVDDDQRHSHMLPGNMNRYHYLLGLILVDSDLTLVQRPLQKDAEAYIVEDRYNSCKPVKELNLKQSADIMERYFYDALTLLSETVCLVIL